MCPYDILVVPPGCPELLDMGQQEAACGKLEAPRVVAHRVLRGPLPA